MEKFITYLKQRRIWAGIVSVAGLLFGYLGLNIIADPQTVTHLFANFGIALANVLEAVGPLVVAALAIWSYFRPKQQVNKSNE